MGCNLMKFRRGPLALRRNPILTTQFIPRRVTTKVPPKCHQNKKGKRAAFRVCLQTIDFIGYFGSVTGARTRTLRLERGGVGARDRSPASMGSGKYSVLLAVAVWEGRRILPDTTRTKNSRQRRLVQRDLPLRTPQRGSGKSEPISEDTLSIELSAPASASGSGIRRLREVQSQRSLLRWPLLD
jgi:hypothetical protein